MSRPSNKKIAAILRETKKFLSKELGEYSLNKSRWICYAMDKTMFECNDIDWICENIIMARLGNAAFIEGWLRRHVAAARVLDEENPSQFAKQCQDYRHRWLDALIEEFSK